jgi:D-arginine dehydrogenase
MYDFVVLGAGIAGASIAYELSHRARVCVVEAEGRPGLHSTGRSAALFAPSYGGREIRAITRASRVFLDAPPVGFCERPLLQARGCLYIATAAQRSSLNRMIGEIRASGGAVSLLGATEARKRVPLLRESYVAGAALDTDAKDIDVDALHQGFLRGAKQAGADIRMGERVLAARRDAGLWVINLSDGEVAALAIGVQPLRRTALLVDPPAGCDVREWPAIMDCEEQFYCKPDAGKLLLSPADEIPDIAGDAQPEELDIAVAVDRVQAALDIEVRRVNHSWAGLRTFAPDRKPLIGFDPQAAGFFWCAGQGGYGIQTAPAMSRMAAALALGEPVPADILNEGLEPTNLSPERFAGTGSKVAKGQI